MNSLVGYTMCDQYMDLENKLSAALTQILCATQQTFVSSSRE